MDEELARAVAEIFDVTVDAVLGDGTGPADADDRLPRRRNPRIGCYEHASGTWIHGDPHDCPLWLRR